MIAIFGEPTLGFNTTQFGTFKGVSSGSLMAFKLKIVLKDPYAALIDENDPVPPERSIFPDAALHADPAFAPLGVCPLGQKKISRKLTVAVPPPSKMPLMGLAMQDAAIAKMKKKTGSLTNGLTVFPPIVTHYKLPKSNRPYLKYQ